MKVAIHWFRRDLRITDNTALAAAARAAEFVIPVYVRRDWRGNHRWTGPHRQAFLCGSVRSLAENLERIGGRLIVRSGDAVEELERLAVETRAEAIFFNRDPDPFGRKVEERLAAMARRIGVKVYDFKDVCIHERDEILTGKGEPFRVFTPYSKAWLKLDHPRPTGRLRKLRTPESSVTDPLPSLAGWDLTSSGTIREPGEPAARKRLKAFLATDIARYADCRNNLAAPATSRLSQDLRFGLLSIREVFERCQASLSDLPADERKGVHAFINELIWREFSMQVLWHWPQVLEQDFQPKYRGVRWPGTEADFDRWRNGETGFPIVDAAMRELRETGFMPNRARMIVAMFLTKDLHVHWRQGESWFMQQLTDGEIAINNFNWQWCAGTGADAAPYFRIQNPWTQGKRYDPDGAYIKRWLPEMRDVSATRLFAPPPDGMSLVRGYPLPIVDHRQERERTLRRFRGK